MSGHYYSIFTVSTENGEGGPGRLHHVILQHKQYNSRGLSNYRGAIETDKPQTSQALILVLETNHNRMAVVQETGLGSYIMTSYHDIIFHAFLALFPGLLHL